MKRLHKLLFISFIKPLIATFFIAQFILILQFLWQHIDDLAGKGLEWQIIAELLLYASASLVPLALPLAVLVSSIMTFGNLGENFELTAIKSSGISLQKFMKPLIVLVTILGFGAFLYSNHVIPYANLKALSLRYDIKNQREELQIREGVFYKDIEGYTIKVGHKNPKTKLMKDIMIYEHDRQKGNRQVTMADSGYIKMSSDKTKLLVVLYHGLTYEEMEESKDARSRREAKEYPFQKRKFDQETLLIDISGFNFERTDEGLFKDSYQMRKLHELEETKDSLAKEYHKRVVDLSKVLKDNVFVHEKYKRLTDKKQANRARINMASGPALGVTDQKPGKDVDEILRKAKVTQPFPIFPFAVDSIQEINDVVSGQAYEGNFIPAAENGEARIPYKQQSKLKISDYLSVPEYWEFNREKFQQINGKKEPFEVSSLLSSLSSLDKISVLRNALGNARQNSQKITNSKRRFEQMEKDIFKHQIYWHKKLTLSFACIIFFFIGAPLGSIIRKGGLGTPLVISVILFIVYYIISISGENFVEKGVLPATLGMWLSSMIFLPVGVFLTYKATNDSVILNTETYIRTFKKFITFRLKPSIAFMRTNR